MVIVIYRYVERIGGFSLPPIFPYNMYNHEKYYPGETFNIHIQSLIILSRRKIGQLPPKKGKGKLMLFFGNGEWVILVYDTHRSLAKAGNHSVHPSLAYSITVQPTVAPPISSNWQGLPLNLPHPRWGWVELALFWGTYHLIQVISLPISLPPLPPLSRATLLSYPLSIIICSVGGDRRGTVN